jgi:glycosyltransferase domain-containing protein
MNPGMSEILTLIIPTHNRHQYLDRALAYYKVVDMPIYVLDSTPQSYDRDTGPGVTYFHLKGYSLTEKLDFISSRILTPFVVMCADDDFLIPESIQFCTLFLENNPSYTAAMGNSIYYRKESVHARRIIFTAIYTDRLSFQLKDDDPFKRIQHFFSDYRTIFYAVQRAESFIDTFKGAGNIISNLFLNEYLTAVIPTLKGKIAELPVLYHIREYAMDSGDKTTVTLDAIFTDAAYKEEYGRLLSFCAPIASAVTGKDAEFCKKALDEILTGYARQIPILKNHANVSGIKNIGNIISRIPFVGKATVAIFRRFQREKALRLFVKSKEQKKTIYYYSTDYQPI